MMRLLNSANEDVSKVINFIKKKDVTPPKTYSMKVIAKSDLAEIYLYGDIGASWFSEGITASQFSKDLKDLGNVSKIDIRINSNGGDVFEGRTIYSLLVDHKAKKTIYVDGLAASIASLIAMAGDKRIMADGAFMMIHNAWGFAMGDSAEMMRTARLLDSVSASIADTYASRSGYDRNKIVSMMNDETWMDAKQCLDTGFCTKVSDVSMKLAASILPKQQAVYNYRHIPLKLRPNRAAAEKLIKAMGKA
jgi:ATP-dependent Clp protease protease subunit